MSITGVDNKYGNIVEYDPYKDSISLKGENSGLNWLSSNNTYYLRKGTHYVSIHSDSKIDLDAVLVYEDSNTKSGTRKNSSECIRDLLPLAHLQQS